MATTIPLATNTPTLSSPGLGSGLDINGIVQKLMSVEQQPLTDLNNQETQNQTKISAFGSLKSALASLQSSLGSLTTASGFQALNASVSDTSVLAATLGTGAVAGNYAVEVSALAQAQKLVSGGMANTTDVVGTGTLTFDFGTTSGGTFTSNGAGSRTITIDSSNDTLAGIRDAVNAANIGVTATIVNDGSANGNRLVFTSNATGATNSMRITTSDGDGNNTDMSGLSQLAYDPAAAAGAGANLTQKVAAQNAQLTVDGIAISKPGNTITDAIQGVTLNLAKTNVGAPVSLAVSSNPGSIVTSLTAFVQAYNNLDGTIDSLTAYDPTQKQASILTGDATVRTIQTQLRSLLGGSIGSGTFTTLAQVGITFQADGTLAIDSTKLNNAISTNPQAITQLFAAVGSTTDALTSVTGFGSNTQAGDYAVNVTQLATRGQLAGSAAAGLTITAGVNDSLTVNVDGINTTVTLRAGAYADANALASEVQAEINGATALVNAQSSVAVSASGGVLTVTSQRYGSASVVSASGNAAITLFGNAPTSTAGVDVAGTLSGIAALGSGQTLIGAPGSAADGLKVSILGGGVGARGTATYSRGFATRLNDILGADTATGGPIDTETTSLTNQDADIEKQKDQLNQRLAQIQANYMAQFNALDTLMASLQAQSSALTQELAAIAANTPTAPSASSNK